MSAPTVAALDRRDGAARRSLPVDAEDLAAVLAAVLAAEGVHPRAEASLTLVDEDVMAGLNADHLGVAGPTDVLSFPIDGADPVPEHEPWMVGDVVLCPSVAAAQASGHAGTVTDELALLVVHGGLHLCGWDHATPAERDRMWDRERELLAVLGRPPSGDPWAAVEAER